MGGCGAIERRVKLVGWLLQVKEGSEAQSGGGDGTCRPSPELRRRATDARRSRRRRRRRGHKTASPSELQLAAAPAASSVHTRPLRRCSSPAHGVLAPCLSQFVLQHAVPSCRLLKPHLTPGSASAEQHTPACLPNRTHLQHSHSPAPPALYILSLPCLLSLIAVPSLTAARGSLS